MAAIAEGPSLVHLEKPVCPPDLLGADALVASARENDVMMTVGYDLVLGAAFLRMEALIEELLLGPIQTIDVETREHWGGIFAAHPWLDGPKDSISGFGNAAEVRQASIRMVFNMWQHLAQMVGAGQVIEGVCRR